MDSRPIVSRDFVRRSVAPMIVLAGPEALAQLDRKVDAGPILGSSCLDWIDRARQDAERCIPPSLANANNACGVDANGNPVRGGCSTLLREVSLGGSNVAAIAPGATGIITIPIEANFKPLMLQVDPAVLAGFPGLRATNVQYGPTSKLINQFVLLAGFDVTSDTGGYRLPHDRFLTAGQTIQVSVFNPAANPNAVPIDTLVINAFGFTDAP